MSKNIRWDEAQKAILLDFMDSNPDFAAGRLLGPLGKQKEIEMWKQLANVLNSTGVGAVKTAEKWMRTWSDWKCNTKFKASEIKNFASKTGGGEKCPKKLSELELRLLEFIGWGIVTGLQNIPEAGLKVPDAKSTAKEPSHQQAVGPSDNADEDLSLQELMFIDCDVVNEANGGNVLFDNHNHAEISMHATATAHQTPVADNSLKRKRNSDTANKSSPRTGDHNPYASTARTFEQIEENRTKHYEEISVSLKEISASFKVIAESKVRKLAILERLVAAKEAKYGIVRHRQ